MNTKENMNRARKDFRYGLMTQTEFLEICLDECFRANPEDFAENFSHLVSLNPARLIIAKIHAIESDNQ